MADAINPFDEATKEAEDRESGKGGNPFDTDDDPSIPYVRKWT